ncbi:DUF2683 family protein [Methanoregula sp.]|uniref:DUF2683 family protein n=1 Tax=Methanoregula sp. TaxID=2052170 RepID=UPI003BAF5288
MPSGRGTRAKGTKGTKKSGITYTSPLEDAGSVTPAGVQDSSLDAAVNRKIETLLTDIVTRLDRIEEKIDENVYPPESAIRPEFIRQVKKAEADIRKGKGKTYESMGAFIKAISE